MKVNVFYVLLKIRFLMDHGACMHDERVKKGSSKKVPFNEITEKFLQRNAEAFGGLTSFN
jgi:hypothetical protein